MLEYTKQEVSVRAWFNVGLDEVYLYVEPVSTEMIDR